MGSRTRPAPPVVKGKISPNFRPDSVFANRHQSAFDRVIVSNFRETVARYQMSHLESGNIMFLLRWCPRSDSNRHASRRRILSPLRLPFHHSGTAGRLPLPRDGVNRPWQGIILQLAGVKRIALVHLTRVIAHAEPALDTDAQGWLTEPPGMSGVDTVPEPP